MVIAAKVWIYVRATPSISSGRVLNGKVVWMKAKTVAGVPDNFRTTSASKAFPGCAHVDFSWDGKWVHTKDTMCACMFEELKHWFKMFWHLLSFFSNEYLQGEAQISQLRIDKIARIQTQPPKRAGTGSVYHLDSPHDMWPMSSQLRSIHWLRQSDWLDTTNCLQSVGFYQCL